VQNVSICILIFLEIWPKVKENWNPSKFQPDTASVKDIETPRC